MAVNNWQRQQSAADVHVKKPQNHHQPAIFFALSAISRFFHSRESSTPESPIIVLFTHKPLFMFLFSTASSFMHSASPLKLRSYKTCA
jgi:hypothetical protein